MAIKLLILIGFCVGTMMAQDLGTAAPPPRKFQLGAIPDTNASATELLSSVSHADLYCAGFITRDHYSRDRYVLGGWNSPAVTRFVKGDLVYLEGTAYEQGTRISIIRQLKDPNRMSAFKPAKPRPQPFDLYAELGYADIVEIRGNVTIAKVEFSCDSILPGDLVVPFVTRDPISVRRTTTTDLFPAEKPRLSGQIVALQDFDNFVGTGHKVYFNLGSEKDVKPGDYFLVTRGYTSDDMDVADAVMLNADMYDDSQAKPAPVGKASMKKLPRRVLGEVVVLEVTSAGSTGMITFSTEELHPGDTVQSE